MAPSYLVHKIAKKHYNCCDKKFKYTFLVEIFNTNFKVKLFGVLQIIVCNSQFTNKMVIG